MFSSLSQPKFLPARASVILCDAFTFLCLTFLLLAPHAAHAQGQWYPNWIPCYADGRPIPFGSDSSGFYPLYGTLTGSATGSQSALLYEELFGADPFGTSGSTVTLPIDTSGNDLVSGIEAGADNAEVYDYDDGLPPESISSQCSGKSHISLQAYFLWQPSYYSDDPPSSPPPPPPAAATFLLRSELTAWYANTYWLWPGTSDPNSATGEASSASVQDDMFGEQVSVTAPPPPYASTGGAYHTNLVSTAGGLHLVTAGLQMVNGKGIYKVTLSGDASASASDSMNGVYYYGDASAEADLRGNAKHDDRGVRAFPLGHEPTFRKEGWLVDNAGNQILDRYGYPIGKAVQNTPQDDALQVDIGVPAKNYSWDTTAGLGVTYSPPPDTSSSVYKIEYDATVSGGPYYPVFVNNNGDSYHWNSSHTGQSDSAVLPHLVGLGDYSIFPFPITYNAPYVLTTLYGDPKQNTVDLHKQDADGTQIDHIYFHYNFFADGADATYNLYLHLHLLHENWTLENTYTELPSNTPNAPATQLSCNPSPQTGGHPTVYTRNAIPRFVQYTFNGITLGVTVAGQLLEPEVNAFLAATGLGIQQITPQPTTESFPDTISDWQAAKDGVNRYNHPELMQPASLAQTDPMDDAAIQASCTYELWERVYNKHYTWVGDNYGANGYIGPDTWITTEPWSRPIEHRYTQVDIPPTTPNPGS